MIEKPQSELIVEILNQVHEWGRGEYIRVAKSQGRDIHILSLADSIPPKDNFDETWLDIKKISDAVSEKIRELYPRFLHQISKDTDLLDITVLDKKISLYWLMPISEMSILRNSLIDKIYALFVLKEVLSDSTYQKVFFILDDALLEQPVREICKQFDVQNIELKIIKQDKPSSYQSNFSLMVLWWTQFLTALAYWFIFNVFNIGKLKKEKSADILGLTIFPTLWGKNNQGVLKNLAFGDFPAELKKHGHDLKYLAIPTMKPRTLLSDVRYWQITANQNEIFFTHALISFRELLSIYFRRTWGKKLSTWLKKIKNITLRIDNIDISKLVFREFQHEFWNQGLLQSLIAAYASASATQKVKNISSAICAFEFQPIEKAFVAGIKKINPNIKTIGLQTSIIGKSHLGYYFLPEQIKRTNELNPPFAPLPDYIAAYGETTYNILTKKIPKNHVSLTGPIRYPYLKIASQINRTHAEKELKNRFNLNKDSVLVLMALPSLKHEALSIIEWAVAIAEKYPQIHFLVRFHYWAVLTEELKNISQAHSFSRYQIASSDLYELLLAARFMITGTSSVGIEAMVSGCMPVSYKPTRRYDFGRIQDVEEGAFFYTNQIELQNAINECVLQSQTFMQKKSQWENNIQKLCTPLDGNASPRFYSWLAEHGVFDSQSKGQYQ